MTIQHPIPPLFDKNSKILILGSFPSVKSREQAFFYGHPQNRFWRVIAHIFNDSIPNTVDEKRTMLLKNNIALWDVIASCDIIGSSDSSIKNVLANDISTILNSAKIEKIIVLMYYMFDIHNMDGRFFKYKSSLIFNKKARWFFS